MGRTTEGDCEKTQVDNNAQHTTLLNKFETMLLAVNPAIVYHVVGSVRGRDVRFMLDTGAAISLISDQTWRSIDSGRTSVANWDGHKLVVIEGSAIPILGVAQSLSINFTCIEVSGDFIIASALNSEAILGLDFLERNQCCINTEQKVLHLKGRALRLTRDTNSTAGAPGSKEAKAVILQEQVVLPPHSVMEVVARVEVSTVNCDCVLLVEDLSRQSNSVVVASALVTPR